MSSTRYYCVVMTGEHRRHAPWGPFADKGLAEEFAEYVTREIGPAEARPMQDPVRDLLAWRRAVAAPAMRAAAGTNGGPVTNMGGHLPSCARLDPHFFPGQCSPNLADFAEISRDAG